MKPNAAKKLFSQKPLLMLAPMQGLTNRVLRQWFINQVAPDMVFTEFVRVQTRSRKRVTRSDLAEVSSHGGETPLVVQMIGHGAEPLCEAAEGLEMAGARHLNLNLGCPYGRMLSGATGGELLREPLKLAALLQRLRAQIKGDFSIKCRAGYDDPRQIFELLPVFEDCGVDWLILHPRTVEQRYTGHADHELTAEVAAKCPLPLVANGDINDVATGLKLLQIPGISGLMLGRGALADPFLFTRLRAERLEPLTAEERSRQLQGYIAALIPAYLEQFCGERQALMKLKDLLNFIPDPARQRVLGKMKRAQSLDKFRLLLQDV
ncbi:tRNA dihydrouridine synthase [Geopsychrobacter electrodiphilus]|uniref:tRNA dihydrouridine synthase n=1 Tax=Geopsychrobacter electrodiphilus TaxID=225196 RepID=UPI001FDEBD7B|nr:tRNA-dihydrouridine synthase family protein [Geopsychrobacter electrodiphilus]